jgi:hypothetical protein
VCIGVDCVIPGINGDYFTEQQWSVGYIDGGVYCEVGTAVYV